MPTDLNQLLALLREHGELAYSLVFTASATHNMLVTLLAGYAVQLGVFDWSKLVVVAWLGTFIGDAIRFWIGRHFGVKWLSPFPRIEHAVHYVARLVEHHYVWLIFVHRYPNGIRNAAGFAFGISSIPTLTFLLLNFVSAGIWAVATVSAGYAFSHLTDKALTNAASHLSMALLVAFVALFWFLGKRLDRIVEKKT